MKKLLFANPEKCTGCSRCTYICSAVKENVFAPAKARLYINNIPHRGYAVPSICFQCPKADCMDACPEGAMSRDENGAIIVNKSTCTGCGACVDACTYGLVGQDEDGIAYKCDLCGGDPACVKECQPGAIVFQEKSKELIQLKGKQMRHRSKSGTPSEKRRKLANTLLTQSRDTT